jgi:hypothetical protein
MGRTSGLSGCSAFLFLTGAWVTKVISATLLLVFVGAALVAFVIDAIETARVEEAEDDEYYLEAGYRRMGLMVGGRGEAFARWLGALDPQAMLREFRKCDGDLPQVEAKVCMEGIERKVGLMAAKCGGLRRGEHKAFVSSQFTEFRIAGTIA